MKAMATHQPTGQALALREMIDPEQAMYGRMQPAVNALCRELEAHPEDWHFATFVFYHKKVPVNYWYEGSEPVINTWDGHSRTQVFSVAQGNQIRRSVEAALKALNGKIDAVMNDTYDHTDEDVDNRPWYKRWWHAFRVAVW